MNEKKYRICLSVPLGERLGTMVIQESYGRLNGWLEVMDHKNMLSGRFSADGHIEFSGTLRTLISTVHYTATGVISGRSILLDLKTSSGAYYPVFGEEINIDEEIL